ncbi:transmembrane protein 104-like protein, partial [Leptotrombidium deliense]
CLQKGYFNVSLHIITNPYSVSESVNDDSVGNTSVAEEEKLPLMTEASDGSQQKITSLNIAFDIKQRVELGRMAHMFLPKYFVTFFYVCIAVYLYGDLAIYGAAISKTMRNMTCDYMQDVCNASLQSSDQCWTKFPSVTRTDAYRIYLTLVLLLLGPFAFFNVQKTKYLQIVTGFFRWFSFISMIVLSCIGLSRGKSAAQPSAAKFYGIPSLFGICVYSFMCHHSLPSLLTPIKKKRNLFWLLVSDYGIILIFYCILSFTGVFTFSTVEDMYTLNFAKCSPGSDVVPKISFFEYFLPLFPVFTLSTNFPIIAVTLCNNLKTLFLANESTPVDGMTPRISQPPSFLVERILFPLLAVVPPVLVAFSTEDLEVLVGFVGSYAGSAIQYIIPALLLTYSRKILTKLNNENEFIFGAEAEYRQRFQSPFKHNLWPYFVIIWAFICILFVSVHHIITWVNH